MPGKFSSSKILLLVIALGLTLAAGHWLGRRQTSAATHATPSGSTQPSSALANTRSTNSPASTLNADAKTASAPFAKRAAQLTGSLAAEDERHQLIEQWAHVDPRTALEFARTQLKGDRQAYAISSAIAIWGKNDPAAAWAWVGTEMPEATHHVDTLLEVFGKQSTELAGKYASEYAIAHPEAALEVNLAALLGVAYRGDFAGARDYIERHAASNDDLRANLNNFVAGQWARYAPAEAAAWVLTLPEGPLRAQALVGLGESWSETDPAAAAAFAATLRAGETRSLAMRQAISKWVEQDPLAARKWVMQTDQYQDFDAAIEAIATQNNFMHRQPAQAMTWATGIFDAPQRFKTMSIVLHNWYHLDRTAATNYLNTSPEFTFEQRAELFKQLQPSG